MLARIFYPPSDDAEHAKTLLTMELPGNENFVYAVVLDFEATCGAEENPHPQEIIEFPSVLLELKTGRKIDEFTSFIRPVHNTELTKFCIDLTSIEQDDVDNAPSFADVLERHIMWLGRHGVNAGNGILVTCGDWDLQIMFPKQCGIARPEVRALYPIYSRWLNVKSLFCAVVGRKKAPGMLGMIHALGLTLQGRHHRGIDDCRNIANILLSLTDRGGRVGVSGSLPVAKFPPLRLVLRCGNMSEDCVLYHRTTESLHRLAQRVFRLRSSSLWIPGEHELKDTSELLWLKTGQEVAVIPYESTDDGRQEM